MRGKRVVVFGGSGFVGRHVIKRLAAKNAMIRVPARDPDRAGHLRPLGDVGQIVPMRMAGTGEGAVADLVDEADLVINLVGILHERRPGDFQRIHAELAGTIARIAKARGIERLVQMSALGADPESESLYAQSRAGAEKAVREAYPEATILRPSIIFGPEDSFFNRFGRMAMLSPALPLIDGGHTRFQPVYVGDVADAIMKGLEDPDTEGRLFELGGPRIYTFRELLDYLLEVLGRRRWLMPLPSRIAEIQARFLEFLPDPPLTRDQIKLLKTDNVVSGREATLADLGLRPTPLEVIVPRYVGAYARHRIPLPVA